MREDTYYQAMLARDARFDGKFYVGVRTTGVYCRPICPAKPKRENVEFFPHRLAAERAGYRPCLRCRPESAPQSPVWIGSSAIVRRALQALHGPQSQRAGDEWSEDRFAERFGVSARHLRRLFIDEIGKTPKQLSFENRLGLARKLLTETALPVTEIAFAAGFRSIRRFNDAFKDRFKRSPRDLRRRQGSESSPTLRISLSYRPPFDFTGLLSFYEAHRMGELEWVEREAGVPRFHRVIDLGGAVAELIIADDPGKSRLWVEFNAADPSRLNPQLQGLLARIRAQFDLDSDPIIVANAVEADPGLRKLVHKYPGTRLPSGWDAFEVGVSVILGQFVSVEAGRRLTSALIEIAGTDSGLKREGRVIRFFPNPERLATADLSALKTTGARRRTVIAFARAVASGALSLEPTQDVAEFTRNALAIPGIGPWTASYLALKVLRHTDAFPETDLILRRALDFHPMEAIARASPWRAYVAILLWREYAKALQKKPPPRRQPKRNRK